MPSRLAKKLLHLVSEHGRMTTEGILIDRPVPQADLARMLGVTQRTVARHMRMFRSRGLVGTQLNSVAEKCHGAMAAMP